MRLATHASMRGLVERHSLEFYPLGGDPRVLAEFAAESRGTHLRAARPPIHELRVLLMPVVMSGHKTCIISVLKCPSDRNLQATAARLDSQVCSRGVRRRCGRSGRRSRRTSCRSWPPARSGTRSARACPPSWCALATCCRGQRRFVDASHKINALCSLDSHVTPAAKRKQRGIPATWPQETQSADVS